MKKIIFTFLLFSNFLQAQSLSINETLEYLNDLLYETGDDRNNPESVSLKENGKLILKTRSTSTHTEIDLVNGTLWKGKYSMKKISSGISDRGLAYIYFRFGNYPIQEIDTYHKETKNVNKFNYPLFNLDKYTAKKIENALKYLMDKINSDEKYNIIDEDPFAPANFNPNSFSVLSDKNSGQVKLLKQSGVYHINISIGGITEYFVFDTGASDVLISTDLERQLISKGFLKKENYLQDGLYRIADGSIIRQRRLLIPKLTIGDFTLINVQASVTNSSTLLLGKSVLDKFKSWNIDNINQTLELNK